jgi:hypothetical protein
MARKKLILPKLPPRRSLREEDEARLQQPFVPRDGIRGRKPGSRNVVTTMLKDAVLIAAKELGEDGKGMGGLVGWLKRQARAYPEEYLRLLARILPLQVNAVHEVDVTHRFRSEEEIKADLARRGLVIEGSIFDVGKKATDA